MAFFVWSRMQTESRTTLPAILAVKELERSAGNGVFWWGVENSSGPALRKAGQDSQAEAYFLGWRLSGTTAIRMR
jgi:hypothetical protein